MTGASTPRRDAPAAADLPVVPDGFRGARRPRRLRDSRAFIYAMLFVALGPLALPMLLTSRAFTWRGKLILTVVVLVLTAALVVETVRELPRLMALGRRLGQGFAQP